MLQLWCLSGLSKLVDADDSSCGGGGGPCPCLLHSALCCPNDSLDGHTVVIEIIQDEGLLEDLAIAASLAPGQVVLPPTTGHHCNENVTSGCWWGGGVSSSAGGTPPVHAALLDISSWAAAWTTTTSSLATRSSSSPPPQPGVSRLVVPRRERDRPSVLRGARSGPPPSVDMPSIPTPNNDNGCRGSGVRQQGLMSPRWLPRSSPDQRACSHCDSMETPRWRPGPDGPSTLCNACGLRYTREQAVAAGVRTATAPT